MDENRLDENRLDENELDEKWVYHILESYIKKPTIHRCGQIKNINIPPNSYVNKLIIQGIRVLGFLPCLEDLNVTYHR